MRDPLLPEGAPPIPMRILGQDPAKMPPAAKDRRPGAQGGRNDAAATPTSPAPKAGLASPGILAKAVQVARGVPEAKITAEPIETADDLAAQLMEDDNGPICPECC